MRVTKIEPLTKAKYKIYVDEQFAFVLYKGELSRFQIKEGGEITQQQVAKIKTEVVLKRAKLRALHLLNDMDRTEGQLRQKLKSNGYTEEIIDQALAYVRSFGYINDKRYICRFIESRMEKKSRKEIFALLVQKGLKANDIEEAISEIYEGGSEVEAIRELARKRRFEPGEADEQERQKFCAYLARKGFRYEDIRQVIQVSSWNA